MNIFTPKKQSTELRARSKQPAYSLVFAFLVMTVIMIIAGTTIENTTNKVRYFNELDGTSQARLAAESAAEMAIQEIADYGVGYNPGNMDSVFCSTPDSATSCTSPTIGTSYGNYEIHSLMAVNNVDGLSSSHYYSPIPGTGDAGLSNNCSINEDVEVDDPCNWGKLTYGQSLTLPLIADDDGDDDYLTPADISFTDWTLKIRTPCSDGTYDSSCTRYSFSPSSEEEDDTIVFWQLVGESETDTESLVPDDDIDLNIITFQKDRASSSLNTEIYESLIDSSSDYVVLQSSDFTTIEDFTTDSDWIDLSLQLNIVSTLIDSSGDTIPYLEWQLVLNASEPLANYNSVIVGDGFYQGKEDTYYFPYVITRSSTGESSSIYTLSN